jgi:UDP-N-acetyl-D-mannosaminuronic acid dehydrogenase
MYESQSLRAVIEAEPADVYLVAVPSPIDNNSGEADLRYVFQAIVGISDILKKGGLVIIESTIPPMACERKLKPILEKSALKSGKDFFVAYCPERAIPSNTLNEMINNDRIIGGLNKKSAEMAQELYSCFVKGSIHLTDLRTAGFVKLIENTYRDTNIALSNEFAEIARQLVR